MHASPKSANVSIRWQGRCRLATGAPKSRWRTSPRSTTRSAGFDSRRSHSRPPECESADVCVHRFVEHIGEVELELKAPSEEGIFQAAADAFAELADGDPVGERCTRRITLSGDDHALLLVDWLSELVFLAEVDRFVPVRVTHFRVAGSSLSATVEGRRGRPAHLVKGVTLNNLSLKESCDGWRARVVLDV